MEVKEIIRAAEIESEWLKYYGHVETRLKEEFNDCGFYDRLVGIGYTKRVIPLHQRCAMMCVTSDVPIEDANIEDLKRIYQNRDHSKNVYTTLEYVIIKNIDKEKYIKIIKS